MSVGSSYYSGSFEIQIGSSPSQVTSFYGGEQLPNHQSESPQFFNRQKFDQYGDQGQREQFPGYSRDPITGKLDPLNTQLLARINTELV